MVEKKISVTANPLKDAVIIQEATIKEAGSKLRPLEVREEPVKKSETTHSAKDTLRSFEDREEAVKISEMKHSAKDEVVEIIIEEEPVKVEWARILFRNLQNSGENISFSYNGKYYNVVDGKEIDLPMEVVNHLNGLIIRTSKFVRSASGNSEKEYTEKPRCLCQVLEQYEK